jgi:TolB-like protein/tetratricopeptide (TPR) repeat protein
LLCLAESAGSVVAYADLLHRVWGESGGTHEKLSHAVSDLRQALGDDPSHPRSIETAPRRGYRLLTEPIVGSDERAANVADREVGVGFFDELKRRGVLETAVAYLVPGWLIIQVADVMFEKLSLPAWSAVFVTYLVVVGFPIALVLAWFIELTPQGVIFDRDPRARPARSGLGRSSKAILGALAIAAVGVFVYDRYVGLPTEAPTARVATANVAIAVDRNTIAVLPFLNIGGDEKGRVLSMGIPEDVINRLTRIPGLRVASRGDSFSLAPNSASQDVRQRLRVAYYLEGSVRVTEGLLRVVVQLIDSETGFHIVSRSFDHSLEDFLAVQDEITSLTVANLRVALPAATQLGGATDGTSVDAYVHYRNGMDALYKPATAATIGEALTAFEKALDLDADYAAAHAGICLANVSGYSVTNDAAYIDAAEPACDAALGLNANLDIVHTALGELYLEQGRHAQAEAAFTRAFAINQNSVKSLIGLGDVYSRQQKLSEAEHQFARAIGLQPGNWEAYNSIGGFLYGNGRYEEAAVQYREVVSLNARNMTGLNNLGSSLLLSGKFAEAASAYERSIGVEPSQVAYSNLGLLYYYLGDIDAAVSSLEKATEMAPNDFLVWSNLGDGLSFSATPEQAREAFVRAEALAESRLAINRRDAYTIASLAWIKAMLDRFDEAERLIADALTFSSDPYVHYINALILARRGDTSGAIDNLDIAAERGYPRALIAAEPHLRSLKGEPRFRDLVGANGQ